MPLVAEQLIGVSFDGSYHWIDTETLETTTIGDSQFSLNALARDGAGRYVATGGNVATGRLVEIDPVAGADTTITTFSLGPMTSIRGLAYSSDNRLLAVNNENDVPANDYLYTIDDTDGTWELIGDTGMTGLQGLAFSPQGELFGWDVNVGLVVIDPATGATTDVDPDNDGSNRIESIVFSSDGQALYGARNELFTIDRSTGFATSLGSLGVGDMRGLEIAVPEPSTPILVVCGLALGMYLRSPL